METNVGSDRIVPQTIETPTVQIYTVRDRSLDVDPQVTITYSFRNCLRDPVVAIMRNNLAFNYQPLKDVGYKSTDQFTITVTYSFLGGLSIDPYHYLTSDVLELHPDLKLFKEQLSNFKGRIRKGDSISIRYVFTMEDFRKSGGRFHIEDLGICLSLRQDELVDTHPESREGRLLTKNINDGFDFNVLINDPNLNYGDQFININGEVYRVRAQNVPSLKTGVYIRGNPPVPFDNSNELHQRHYTFDEIDKLNWLFPTAAEARSSGDPETQYKQRIREITEKAEREKLEIINRVAEAEAARKEAESAAKLAEIKQKTELSELEAKFKREEYERKRMQVELDQRLSLEEHTMKREIEIRNKILAEEKFRRDKTIQDSNVLMDVVKVGGAIIGLITSVLLIAKR